MVRSIRWNGRKLYGDLPSDVGVGTANNLYTSPDNTPFGLIPFRLDTPIEAGAHGCWHLLDLTNCLTPADGVTPCPAHDEHDQKIAHLIWCMYLKSHGQALSEHGQNW
jgi:hypothetical protein